MINLSEKKFMIDTRPILDFFILRKRSNFEYKTNGESVCSYPQIIKMKLRERIYANYFERLTGTDMTNMYF